MTSIKVEPTTLTPLQIEMQMRDPETGKRYPMTISAAEAGRILGVGKNKILRLIHSGQLPAVRMDKRIRVRLYDLGDFIKSLPPVATAA